MVGTDSRTFCLQELDLTPLLSLTQLHQHVLSVWTDFDTCALEFDWTQRWELSRSKLMTSPSNAYAWNSYTKNKCPSRYFGVKTTDNAKNNQTKYRKPTRHLLLKSWKTRRPDRDGSCTDLRLWPESCWLVGGWCVMKRVGGVMGVLVGGLVLRCVFVYLRGAAYVCLWREGGGGRRGEVGGYVEGGVRRGRRGGGWGRGWRRLERGVRDKRDVWVGDVEWVGGWTTCGLTVTRTLRWMMM